MTRPFLLLTLACMMTACQTIGMGPVVDLDWCARGFVQEQAVLEDLYRRASNPASPQALNYVSLSTKEEPGAGGGFQSSSSAAQRPDIRISMDSPVVSFPSGPSRVAALALPTSGVPVKTIFIIPRHSGFTLNGKPDCAANKPELQPQLVRRFDPQISFLDANKVPIGEPVPGEPTIHRVNGAKRFDVPDSARYLLIHTDISKHWQPLLLAGIRYTTLVPAAGLFVPVTQDGTVRGTSVSTGILSVVLEP